MEEIWRAIPDYEGIYEVSNLGNVKSLSKKTFRDDGVLLYTRKEKILKSVLAKSGYYSICLHKHKKIKSFLTHKLVAMAFLNHTPCGHKLVVDHINDDKLDNRVENLQIVTQRENAYKTQGKYSSQYKGVDYHKKANKWRAGIANNGKTKHLGLFNSEYEAHLEYQKALKEITKGK